jgi:hypothetical protein
MIITPACGEGLGKGDASVGLAVYHTTCIKNSFSRKRQHNDGCTANTR